GAGAAKDQLEAIVAGESLALIDHYRIVRATGTGECQRCCGKISPPTLRKEPRHLVSFPNQNPKTVVRAAANTSGTAWGVVLKNIMITVARIPKLRSANTTSAEMKSKNHRRPVASAIANSQS